MNPSRCVSLLNRLVIKFRVDQSLSSFTNRILTLTVRNILRSDGILAIRLDEIGDVILTSPFLRELRRLYPKRKITLIVKAKTRTLVELCPYVNGVLEFEPPSRGVFIQLKTVWRTFCFTSPTLRHHFALAITPRFDDDSGAAARLGRFSGARERIGFAGPLSSWSAFGEIEETQLRGFENLLTDRIPGYGVKHEVERNLDIIRHLGGTNLSDRLEMWLSSEDEAFAETALAHWNVSDAVIIALAPGAGCATKMWPADRFIKLTGKMIDRRNLWILVVGGKQESSIGSVFQDKFGRRALSVAGQATLRQTAALLRRCSLFIGNDTGPMHMAAAAGVPVVEICCHPRSGADGHYLSPLRFGPWGVPHRVLRPEKAVAPCSRSCGSDSPHCILSVTVEEAVAAAFDLLDNYQFEIGTRYQGARRHILNASNDSHGC